MFDPVELYHVAVTLYTNNKPFNIAIARTCINRFYYASHLVAREKGNIKDESGNAHKAVIEHYKKTNKQLGNKLADLFIRRKNADYNLQNTGNPSPTNDITPKNAAIALVQSKEILQMLGVVDEEKKGGD